MRFLLSILVAGGLLLGWPWSSVSAAPAPPIYWHTANLGLPYDIQVLNAAPTTLYAGTWGQGVYRSADHGATWVTATAGLTLPMYISGGLAVNPVTPTTLFAGDYFGALSGVGIYRSLDGGDSWTASLRDVGVETLLVHPLSPTVVFVGTVEDGLYRSLDNGATWAVSLSARRVQALAAASVAPSFIYAGAGNDLHVSANGGDAWALASTLSSTVTALAAHPVTPTHLYAGTRQHGLWRSIDGGASWLTDTVAGLPGNAWVTSIAIDPISPTTLYAGAWQGRVYRSLDGGVSWEDLGYLGTVQDVLIHPAAPSVIYAATSNNGVFRGSALDHLTMDEIASPQYVNYTFPFTLTARDALGFPLTGMTQAQAQEFLAQRLALSETEGRKVTRVPGIFDLDPFDSVQSVETALIETLTAGGYTGIATLTDSTTSLTPTTVMLVNGVAAPNVKIAAPQLANVITATLPGGPSVTSNPFDVVYAPATHFTFAPIADQIAGEPFTLTITARDAQGLSTPYTGTAILVGSYPLTGAVGTVLLPLQAGPFTDGVWAGQLTVTQAYTELTVLASSGVITGVSNKFSVLPNVAHQLTLLPAPMPDQVAGVPFTLTVSTADRFGNPAIGYTGVLSLTDSTGTVRPITTILEAGLWRGPVVITQPQEGVVITATTGSIATTSSAFTVAPAQTPHMIYLPLVLRNG